MDLVKFQRLMKTGFSVKCHLDDVPEKAKLPAISYNHISHSAAILLSGEKFGRSDTWVANIVTDNDEDLQRLVEEAELLHNQRTDDYQRVFVRVNNIGSNSKDDVTRTTTLTIQTFEA